MPLRENARSARSTSLVIFFFMLRSQVKLFPLNNNRVTFISAKFNRTFFVLSVVHTVKNNIPQEFGLNWTLNAEYINHLFYSLSRGVMKIKTSKT